MAFPPKRSYPRPQELEVYIPQCMEIKIYVCKGGTGGGAGTRDANQDRDGRMAGVDMSV
jgi:hypothetical protein